MSNHHKQLFRSERHSASLRLAIAGVLFSSCVGAFAANAPAATIVYPTGVFPTDGINVQAAADRGGTVLLKATNRQGKPTAFNFGTPDPNHSGTSCNVAGVTVSLNIDVAILGEQVGQKMTTINGGCTPILGLIPVRSKIEGIDFESPVQGAIVLTASTGTEIVGNHINGVIGALIEVESGFQFTDGDGIDLFGDGAPQNSVSGHAIIANNVIENLGADFANGVQLDEVAAEVDISANTIRFAESNGDVQVIGITAFRSHDRVSIVGNEISMGPGSPDAFPAPILVGGDSDARYIVAFNNVVENHPNGDGIEVTGGDFSEPTQGAQILANRVIIHSSSGGPSGASFFGGSGVDVYGAVNNSLIAANVIKGTSAFALNVAEGFVSTSTSDSDQLLINDISGHTSLITDVLFGTNTSNMRFVGHCTSDIDLGMDNKIDCNASANHALAAEENAVTNLRPSAGLRTGARRGMTDVVRNAVRNAIRNPLAK
jgi:hypothetical protein